MFQKLLFPKWLVVLNVVLISLMSVTLVSAHGGNTTLIHSCVNNTSGEIKIIAATATCPSNYRSLDWNIQGPAGQQGPQGLTGPQGLQGIQGPAGISGLEIVTADSGTQNTDIIYVYAECPVGKQVLGGGFSSAGNNLGTTVAENGPVNSTMWLAHLAQNDRMARLWSVQAYAICANVAP